MALLARAASAVLVCNNASALAQLLPTSSAALTCPSDGFVGTLNDYMSQASANGSMPLYEVSIFTAQPTNYC